MKPAILLDGVVRRFPARRGAREGEILALDRVNLTVRPGTVFGVLGPNGAGKTTLLRLVCTLLAPSAGRVEVLGFDTVRDPEEVRRRLGAVLGGERAVYWRLTGRENLLYAAALHDLPPRAAARRAEEVLRLVGLLERADDLVARYSTGMRQRLALARALVHDPPILVLDEPTAGLDPHAAAAMRHLLAMLGRGATRTVVVATHNMVEAERLCGTVGILDCGRLLALGAPQALMAQHAAAARAWGLEPSLEAVFLTLTGRSPASAAPAAP
ncbi:MAG: ABC transporter ATP-binding protein [Armatimonadota bacterium]|nr:ABC transporter ATP-binding protein [Armatimonadota bacterium]